MTITINVFWASKTNLYYIWLPVPELDVHDDGILQAWR